jgi:molecular chaperone DnaJ
MFGDIFGGRGGFGGFGGFGGGSAGPQKHRGGDLRVKAKLTLQDIANGVTKKFKLKKYVPCTHCGGTGAEGNAYETCPECKGTGRIIRTQQSFFGMMRSEVACPHCNGEGKIIKNKCSHCNGEGIVLGEEVVEVQIPAGVVEGMQLSMRGKGNAGKRNGINGDLLILIEEEKHPELVRDENDLVYSLLLDIPTAALGGFAEIPTIDGRVKVTIDPGTQPGKVLRLRGKGLPALNGYGKGDIIVNISVYIPEVLSKEEKKSIEHFRDSENFKPTESVKEKIFRRFKSFFD